MYINNGYNQLRTCNFTKLIKLLNSIKSKIYISNIITQYFFKMIINLTYTEFKYI